MYIEHPWVVHIQCVLKLSSSLKFYAFAHHYCVDYIFWISNYVIKTIAPIPSSFIPIIVVSSTGTKAGSVKRYQSSFSSSNVSHATVEVLAEAVGLIEAGWARQAVANRFGVTTRAVRKWLTKRRSGEALANKPGRGPKPKLDRVSKIVIGKPPQKKGFSTWKLARKLTGCGHPVSKSTMHKYLCNNIHAVPYVERTLLEKMSEAIYQQDGAPACTSKRAQEWSSNNLPSIWRKCTQPGNSPDLSPIENLSAILQKEPGWMA